MEDIFNSVTGEIITSIIIGIAVLALINPIKSKINNRKAKKEEGQTLSEKSWQLMDKIFFLEQDILRYIYLTKIKHQFEKDKLYEMIPSTIDTLEMLKERSIDTINKICKFNNELYSSFDEQLGTIDKIKNISKNTERIIVLHNNDLDTKMDLLDKQQKELEKLRLMLTEQIRSIS
uniref:hypothetical protein n=1 Tax=Bacillus inaquosorum TaxID=483913 RepID=UPI00227FF455|nr:hypothetical protein [Bacillus inaquosorum]MCY8277316.1 hypothetical protein [Bacillus inaquosorum]MCY8281220.1 hypothetical protein [Bacillus inaquosorum]